MYFDSFSAAMSMDGHGVFVWGAYAMTALVIGFLLLVPVRRRKNLQRELAGQIRRSEAARTADGSRGLK